MEQLMAAAITAILVVYGIFFKVATQAHKTDRRR